MTHWHTTTATWISALASIVAIIVFLTGKQRLADFFTNKSDSHAQITPAPIVKASGPETTPKSIALEQLIELTLSDKITDLQKENLNKALDGKTVILSGVLIKAQRQGWNYFAEIAIRKDDSQTFYLNIDSSDAASWNQLPPGSKIQVSTKLKLPLIGTMVGTEARLLPKK